MPALAAPMLCLVTDSERCLGRDIVDVVDEAVDGGVGMVQLREKRLPVEALYALGLRLREVTARRALLLVNDSAPLARAIGADGAQLPEAGTPVHAARRELGPCALIGRSVHTPDAAARAERDGADFLIAGAVFPTSSHPGREPLGVEALRDLRRGVALPTLAIGGVTAENVRQVMQAGCSGAAVISAIAEATSPRKAALALVTRMTRDAPR